jgi:hypothetical protein
VQTSVISYLTARPSRDVVKLAKQELTREWWNNSRSAYDLYVATPVRNEIKKGDKDAAQRRMEIMAGIPELLVTDEAIALARRIIAENILPAKAHLDVLHISVAAVNGMDYLATWNCKHISNAVFEDKICDAILKSGYTKVNMTTPEQLGRV